jgi:hypothetical protein
MHLRRILLKIAPEEDKMATVEQVKNWMAEAHLVGWDWLAQYLVDFAAACRNAVLSPSELDAGVRGTVLSIRELLSRQLRTDESAIRMALKENIDHAAFLTDDVPDEAQRLPFPARPQATPEQRDQHRQAELTLLETRFAVQRAALRRARTPRSNANGRRLAEAAVRLRGYFSWIRSGPSKVSLQGLDSESLRIKEFNTEDDRINGFARWLNRGTALSADSCMNCWEAVMASAWVAGLVTVQQLRLTHAKAAVENDQKKYFAHLAQSLGAANECPLVPSIGLIPQLGDLIFLDGLEHVVICVGIDPEPEVLAGIQVMSLWMVPDTMGQKAAEEESRFQLRSLIDIGAKIYQDNLTFTPCPF